MFKLKSRRSNLLKFHRPKLQLNEAPIPVLKLESKQCIQNLLNYQPPKIRLQIPRSRCAAVLVALFVGRTGDLYVLLSRRASTLRTYAGDTSLPGGKWDAQDHSIEWTARREAFEEIGLPMDRQKVPLLCVVEPFLAGNQLVVIPVVVLILDNTLRPILNAPEVASLFSHPLISLLHSEPPFSTEPEMLEMKYHTYVDIAAHEGHVRMHRFLTGREAGGTKPIFGLTASILIRVAAIGYGREPDFEVFAPDQPSWEERLAHVLRHHLVFREAAQQEGIDPDKTAGSKTDDAHPGARRGRVRSKL
ncbi:Peroxisomal coenzyme A diphosphatase 1, peroxisomal [Sparassis crispa]|uniref:Peroxisomal coenzyme A diphosphatase 1, peroxisomal n=1 Tax=Sparassis crispa TaxID=139825 RepID=A0A401GDE0_9APHY|nr:Peroxisomal coenzyme A diphosphatase 1, peroxisomal [Sparassis crispa]GBE80199.1 Peroxisomal coenzyme A diphosphatase 1, peroxisomal [Sparassis crispa]